MIENIMVSGVLNQILHQTVILLQKHEVETTEPNVFQVWFFGVITAKVSFEHVHIVSVLEGIES